MSRDPFGTLGPSGRQRVSVRVRLLVMMVPTVLLFVVHHDTLASTYPGYGRTAESMAADVFTGTPLRRVVYVLLGVFGLAILAQKPRSRHAWGFLGTVMVLFLVWCAASLLWSSDPVLTGRRLTVLAALSVTALALSRVSTLDDVILWMCASTAFYVILGLISEITLGTFAPASAGYRFAGTLHPNEQGVQCGLLVLSAMALRPETAQGTAVRRAAMGLALLMLTLTKSRATLLCSALGVSAFVWLPMWRRRRMLWAGTGLLGLALGTLLLVVELQWSAVLAGLDSFREGGEAATLTGRVGLWRALLASAGGRLLVGHGYGAFWTEERILDLSSSMGWLIGQSHSGYLELLLELGGVGLVLFVAVLAAGGWRAASYAATTGRVDYAFAASAISFCALHGMVESAVVSGSFLTLAYITILVSLAEEGTPQWTELREAEATHRGTKPRVARRMSVEILRPPARWSADRLASPISGLHHR